MQAKDVTNVNADTTSKMEFALPTIRIVYNTLNQITMNIAKIAKNYLL